MPGEILEEKDPVLYLVKATNMKWKEHVDQLRARLTVQVDGEAAPQSIRIQPVVPSAQLSEVVEAHDTSLEPLTSNQEVDQALGAESESSVPEKHTPMDDVSPPTPCKAT